MADEWQKAVGVTLDGQSLFMFFFQQSQNSSVLRDTSGTRAQISSRSKHDLIQHLRLRHAIRRGSVRQALSHVAEIDHASAFRLADGDFSYRK
jgi:hypothetical protein